MRLEVLSINLLESSGVETSTKSSIGLLLHGPSGINDKALLLGCERGDGDCFKHLMVLHALKLFFNSLLPERTLTGILHVLLVIHSMQLLGVGETSTDTTELSKVHSTETAVRQHLENVRVRNTSINQPARTRWIIQQFGRLFSFC